MWDSLRSVSGRMRSQTVWWRMRENPLIRSCIIFLKKCEYVEEIAFDLRTRRVHKKMDEPTTSAENNITSNWRIPLDHSLNIGG